MNYAQINSIYVSEKDGSDSHLGIHFVNDRVMNGPVKTISRALTIVSEMRRSDYRQPVSIVLMDEEYDFSKPLDLSYPGGDPENLPTVVRDVTFTPFGTGRVLFSGGRRIEGWEEDTFNGIPCLSVTLEDVKNGSWFFSDLYVGGSPAKKTRTPAEGFFYPEAVENPSSGTHVPSRWFIAEKGDIPEHAHNVEDAIINFCHYWVDEHSRIASYDPSTRRVTFDGRTRMTISEKRGTSATMAYYIENLAEAFSNPGEWYLDRTDGKLYYAPKPGETTENLVVYAPVTDRLVNITGLPEQGKSMQGIRFRNIDFAYTKGDFRVMSTRKLEDGTEVPEAVIADGQCAPQLHGVVNLYYAKNCAFEDCGFFGIGAHAVRFHEGCSDGLVTGCRVFNSAGGGVSIGGGDYFNEEISQTHHITVSDCIFENLGLRYFSASGVLIMHGYNNTVEHNTIRSLYYSGVCVGWRWSYAATVCHDNIIRKNHIYDLGRGVLSDMGGVYTLGAQPGTRVEGNLIHDVKSRDYGGWGLYTDEGSAYINMENNICYNCSSNCYHQHYGYMNTLRNNVFVSAGEQVLRITRREAQESLVLSGNIFVTNGDIPMYGNVSSAALASCRNLFWSTDGKARMMSFEGQDLTLSDLQNSLGMETGSVEADPCFTNSAAHDFTFGADSPAAALGIHPIDCSDIGPRGRLKGC
ncbi:MAG: right-handed parallel beta-helix repeat-containing protein [Clostridia bacterium]|nr:right-handed parallel beta-helix repeat-containing protein [Clostridia bacterium]